MYHSTLIEYKHGIYIEIFAANHRKLFALIVFEKYLIKGHGISNFGGHNNLYLTYFIKEILKSYIF